MGNIIDRAMGIIDDHLKDQMSSFSDPITIKPMNRGGQVLEDKYPTHYLPNVGRQVMADGGAPRGFEGRVVAPAPEVADPDVAVPADDGITAYHGTPHKFDEFELSKIGTGEGAQAYGHGLYFAENEDVARGYRDSLAPGTELAADGRRFSDMKPHERDVYNYMYRTGKKPSDAAAYFHKRGDEEGEMLKELGMDSEGPHSYTNHVNFANSLNDKPEFGSAQKGHMYEVRLNAGPEHLLDWDKQLSEQPSYNAVRKHWDDKVGDPDIVAQRLGIDEGSTGRDLYEALSGIRRNQEAASRMLSEMGLRGIRYRDAGSRGQDEKSASHNIVIFDPQHIKVKRRYAQGGDVPESDDEGIVAYAFGNSVPHIEQRIAGGEFPEIERSVGGAINPIELQNNNLENEARRLILWSQAVAPLRLPMPNPRIDRKSGGKVEKRMPAIDYPLKISKKLEKALAPGEETGHVAIMSPNEFLTHANRLKNTPEDRSLIGAFKKGMKKGEKFKALKLLSHNHADGRHRATAAEELGIKSLPVIDYRKSGLKSMKGVHEVGKSSGKLKNEIRKERADGGPVNSVEDALDVARNLTPLGLYSAAANAAGQIPQKAPIDQILNKIKGSPNVKAEELDQSGVRDAFMGQKSVDPQAVASHLQANLPQIQETVYAKPVVPDAIKNQLSREMYRADYRNLNPTAMHSVNLKLNEMYGDKTRYSDYSLPGGDNYREVLLHLPERGSVLEQAKAGKTMYEGDYKSSHWNVPNVLAHLRMKDRVGDNGEKILNLEELQSDWGQEKKKGDQLPNAPHVGSTEGWTDLGLKRALMEAAKGGYDKLAITNGDAQADRYSLRNKVKHIMWSPQNNILNAIDHSGYSAINEPVKKEDLHKYLGKEIAQRLIEQDPVQVGDMPVHHLKDKDLEVGGEGMKGYYDRVLPQRLNKLVSKFDPDAKLKMFAHPVAYEAAPEDHDEDEEAPSKMARLHTLDITPKLRAAILKGLPAYKRGGVPHVADVSPITDRAFDVLSKLSR